MKNMKKLTSLLLALLLLVQVVPTAVLADNGAESAVQEIVTAGEPDTQQSLSTDTVTEGSTEKQVEEHAASIETGEEQQKEEEEPPVSTASEGLTENNNGTGTSETEDITVYVTISKAGTLVMSRQAVTLTGKSTYNIDDALRAAHKAAGKDGNEYYYSEENDRSSGYTGISLKTLWGDSSNAFSYYLNNTAVMTSLAEAVNNGDEVYAFVYSDKNSWSDAYTYFDTTAVSTSTGKDLTVKLMGYTDWSGVAKAIAGATITIDGVSTGIETDENGVATLSLPEKAGSYTISATHDNITIVPPVCDAVVAYVTISNAGTLVMKRQPVVLTGAHNIDEALRAAHKAVGKESEYNSYPGTYGLSLGMLWGDDSGAFYYYLNNTAVMTSLAEAVNNGDEVYAFVYSDKSSWSDAYTYFDRSAVSTSAGSKLTLKLMGYTDWTGIATAITGATITINGEATSVTTDANGKAVVTIPGEEGVYTVSAISADGSMVLVPPVCVVTAKAGVSTSPLKNITLYDSDGSETVFDPSVSAYNVLLAPNKSSVSLAKPQEGYSAKYQLDDGVETEFTRVTSINNIAAGTHVLKVTLTDAEDIANVYTFNITRSTALKTLVAKQGENALTLTPAFNGDADYTGKSSVLLSAGANVKFTPTAYDAANTDIKINDEAPVTDGYTITAGDNVFTITTAPKVGSVERTYTVTIAACEAKNVTVNVPAGAQLSVTDPNGTAVTLPEAVSNAFCDSYTFTGLYGGQSYSYTVGK